MLTLTAPGDDQHFMPSGEACRCTPPGGVDLGLWNASASSRWNLLRTALKAEIPDFRYLRVVEIQDRGALHLHILVHSPIPLDRVQLRRQAIGYGFGHSLDLALIEPGSRKHAYYVAKYVTKSCDQRDSVPWTAPVVDHDTGEIQTLRTHARYRTWSASQDWGLTMKEIRHVTGLQAKKRAAHLREVLDGGIPAPGGALCDLPAQSAQAPP